MVCRAYSHPNPDKHAILNSVSNFVDAISRSVRAGTVRNTKFTVEFRTNVFKLFAGKGEVASKGRGHLYQQADFDSGYFIAGWSQCWDRLGDGCKVVFPIQMHSYIKFSPLLLLRWYWKSHCEESVV